ncbi:MAG: Lrp/AsnC family transcriptional regulator [Rhodobacterales bacterium]
MLDAIDAKILRALVANAKISTADLAKSVGLSTSPCWQRVRRLETDGYITGYAAKLDQYKLGATEIIFVEVSLERHNQDALKAFGGKICSLDEVLEVFLTSGEHDYLLKVAVNGTRGYEQFLSNKLSKIPGIRQTRSSFALRCLKNADVFIP